ncbi:hypothetical protein ACFSGX_11935 [Sphingomonas arantia]|uniref:Transposase n=1 Tax=Sphingomonas arantia TaxID=1460676 RepID=A0ABW4U0C2_9SPHN
MAVNLRDDPEWLQIPLAKREVALMRYKILRAYDLKKEPTTADATAAAAELGIHLRSFYFILRSWRNEERSIFALIPYRTNNKTPRPSRLDTAVADHLRESVRALLVEDQSIAPAKAVRFIEEAWPDRLLRPSGITIRVFMNRMMGVIPAVPGSRRLRFSSSAGDEVQTASRFGEVIIIDHTAPARLLLDGEPATTPTVTLVIDLFTGVPIGAAVSRKEPGPEAVLDALADASERLEELGGEGVVQPRIIYASATSPEWTSLREGLRAGGLDLVEQRGHRLSYGAATKRFIGNKLSSVMLQASKAGQSASDPVDTKENALLTGKQMKFVIDSAINRLMKDRLSELNGGHGVKLLLPEWLSSRGGLRSRTRPLVDLTCKRREQSQEKPPASTAPSRTGLKHASQSVDREFRRTLYNVVDDVVGGLLDHAEVHEPATILPGWLVQVVITDTRFIPEIWLGLARKAIEIAEMQGKRVRFEVNVTSKG